MQGTNLEVGVLAALKDSFMMGIPEETGAIT